MVLEKKESEILKDICNYLDNEKLFFWRSNNISVFGKNNAGNKVYRSMPKFARKGVPDIIIIYKGAFIGVEVKSKTGKVRPEQLQFQMYLEMNGGYYRVVRSIEDTKEFLSEIDKKL